MENKPTENLEKSIQSSFFQKYAIAAVVVIAIVTVWLFLYFIPLRRQISLSVNELNQWGSKITASSLTEEQVEKISNIVAQLKVDIKKIEKKIYHLEDMPIIAKELLKYGNSHKLEITSMTPNYDVLFEVKSLHSEGKPLVKLPISIEMTGRYKNIGKFISGVEKLPFAFAPDGFKLTANPVIYPKINITIKGFLFLLNEEKNKKVSANYLSSIRKDNKV